MIDSLIEYFFIIIDWPLGIVWSTFSEKGDEFTLFSPSSNLSNSYLAQNRGENGYECAY